MVGGGSGEPKSIRDSSEQADRDETLALLREIAARVGSGESRPDDPLKAIRWDMPLPWHAMHLGESLHALRNSAQVLIGMLEQFGSKLDAMRDISQGNAKEIADVKEIARKIEISAGAIVRGVSAVVREKPFLFRDLYYSETNIIEFGLIVCVGGEAIFFMVGAEALLRSAMYQAMSRISDVSALWAIGCGLLALGSATAFASRSKIFRLCAAAGNTLFFTVTGILPIFYSGGILGSWHHILFAISAAWVLSRGPSNAI